jgi:choline kinase
MDALILAAGYGSRLAGVAEAKPLAEVAGTALVEWSVRQAAAAGVRRAVVVTGHAADAVEARLPGIAARCGVAVEPCRLADWSRPNGLSVIAGAARIAGNYLLLMADHLFAAGLLAELMQAKAQPRGAVLAIDRNVTAPAIDPADATWVARRLDGRIARIGKHLASFDAVDCGAFIATPDLAPAIAAAMAAGAAGSLSDGMQWLADRGAADTLDVTGHSWIDVDDPAMLALAERMAPEFLPMGASAARAAA